MPKTRPFDVVHHLDNPEVIRAYVAEMDAEIARMQADIDKLMSERQGWLDEIERLRAENESLRRALDVVPGKPTAEDIEWARRALEGTSHVPNAATVAALEEAERGGGKAYRGTGEQIVRRILREEDSE